MILFRQSVPRSSAQESILRRMSVGHRLYMRVYNTKNPAASVVSGVVVGHFGGEGPIRGYLYMKRRMLPLGVLAKGSKRISNPFTVE